MKAVRPFIASNGAPYLQRGQYNCTARQEGIRKERRKGQGRNILRGQKTFSAGNKCSLYVLKEEDKCALN